VYCQSRACKRSWSRSAESLRREQKGFSRSLSSFPLTSHFRHSKSLTFISDSFEMSTSTTSATLKGLGECVVCGKETSVGCSKCTKAGIDWMYFCSKEHQKLVSIALYHCIDESLTKLFEMALDLVRSQTSLRNEPVSMACPQRQRSAGPTTSHSSAHTSLGRRDRFKQVGAGPRKEP